MPQNPIMTSAFGKNPSGVFAPMVLDADDALAVATGGLSSALNVTASTAIKASAGRIHKVSMVSGTSGTLTINDVAAPADAAASNTIFSGTVSLGQVVTLDFPCAHGISISAVPASGMLAVSYD